MNPDHDNNIEQFWERSLKTKPMCSWRPQPRQRSVKLEGYPLAECLWLKTVFWLQMSKTDLRGALYKNDQRNRRALLCTPSQLLPTGAGRPKSSLWKFLLPKRIIVPCQAMPSTTTNLCRGGRTKFLLSNLLTCLQNLRGRSEWQGVDSRVLGQAGSSGLQVSYFQIQGQSHCCHGQNVTMQKILKQGRSLRPALVQHLWGGSWRLLLSSRRTLQWE